MAEGTNSDWKINELEINNFKSIKNISIKPARVNILIGKPNAGKSNFLEALALSNIENYLDGEISGERFRYKEINSFFYEGNYNEEISVLTNNWRFRLEHGYDNGATAFFDKNGKISQQEGPIIYNEEEWKIEIRPNGIVDGSSGDASLTKNASRRIEKYHFKELPFADMSIDMAFVPYHLLPSGKNLWGVVKHNSLLKEFANDFFRGNGLNILFDEVDKKLDIIRVKNDSYYKIDFSMTPDTFQRMLYYQAAIESNKNAVLLFEEPESQSFPPYIQMLAERIIEDMDNQYFITTHSPFVVEKMLWHASTEDDVKVFITYFEDYQTKVHELSKEEIDQILNYHVDIFFNMDSYRAA